MHAPPEELPDWLPVSVRAYVLRVERMLDGGRESDPIWHQLVVDRRMFFVWKELARHEAADGALAEFLSYAWQWAYLPPHTATQSEHAAWAAGWDHAAERARWSHKHLRVNPELAAALVLSADFYEKIARQQERLDSPLIVKYHNVDDGARGYTRALGALTQKLFHSPLDGTIARTAAVALQREITRQQVKAWRLSG